MDAKVVELSLTRSGVSFDINLPLLDKRHKLAQLHQNRASSSFTKTLSAARPTNCLPTPTQPPAAALPTASPTVYTSPYTPVQLATTGTLQKRRDRAIKSNRSLIRTAYKYFHVNRYIDDIMNVAQSDTHRLSIKLLDIYKGVVNIVDTAHYHTNRARKFAKWISFLDVRLEWDPKTFKITSKLYVKQIVLDLAIGVDVKHSDTDTRQMSMVFASETLRFYFACGEYSDFLHHCVRYMLSFLDKHYPFYLLMSGFLSLWRSGRHSFTKYKNSPAIWHEDIMHRIPARYTRKRRSLIAPTSAAATTLLSLHAHSNTPSPHLDYPTASGTSIPGFVSGGCTHSNSLQLWRLLHDLNTDYSPQRPYETSTTHGPPTPPPSLHDQTIWHQNQPTMVT